MAIGTAFGWGNVSQMALAIALAYLFGFVLTAIPLIRAKLSPRKIASTALASDTVSITIMEVIDNLTVLAIPSALAAGLSDPLFYGSIALGFAIHIRSRSSQTDPLSPAARAMPSCMATTDALQSLWANQHLELRLLGVRQRDQRRRVENERHSPKPRISSSSGISEIG